ncbi:uncharacterized protein LOC135468634 [Liolophura sinensis]|uniref:uncharacterized protein LOC135468634 n=1 Tax=Liolophura sinensis TaxID=3198878 RepID=UPI0031590BA4
MEKIKFYCVAGIHTDPVEMIRSNEGHHFGHHIALPLPDQINVFTVGEVTDFPDDHVVDLQFWYEGVQFKLGTVTKAVRNVVWERKKCDDTLPELLKNSCEGEVLLEGQVKQVMGNASSNRISQTYRAGKRKADNLQEELENTPQNLLTISTPISKQKPGKKKAKQSNGERTPKGPTPRKGKIATRMRALRGESRTPKKNKILEEQNAEKNDNTSEGNSLRWSVCKDVTSRVLPGPSRRWGHTMCVVDGKQAVLIGGQGDKHQLSKDSVWSLNTETRRWKPIKTEAECQNPELRMGHTATFDPMVRCIYVYGGSKNLKWFRDIYTLDLDNWKWQLMKVNGKAPTRAYHTTTLYRHELWIFGGVYPRPNPQPDGCSDELHIFSPVMENWYSPIVTGDKPLARSGHSATLIGDQLVVFGGWDAPVCYSDTFILDMTLLDWSQPKIVGKAPKPRSWHASCALSGQRVLIHGGYDGDLALDDTHIFNLRDKSWTHIKVDSLPSPRTGHVAVCLPYCHDNQEQDEVMVFGGGDNDGAFFTELLSLAIPFLPLAHTS